MEGGTSVPSARGTQGSARQAETRGPSVFVMRDGQLQAVRVRPGVSDGSVTAVGEGELTEDMQVVTGNAIADTNTAAPAATPFMPQRPGGNRQGQARTGAGR